MALSLRVKSAENDRISKFAEKVNLKRLKNHKKMYMESRIIHELIALALDDAKVSEDGEVYIDSPTRKLSRRAEVYRREVQA